MKKLIFEYSKETKEAVIKKIEELWYKVQKTKNAIKDEWTNYIICNSNWEYHTSNLPKSFWINSQYKLKK